MIDAAQAAQLPWLPGLSDDHPGARIALIHGFLAGSHMQRHLLRWVREQGHADAALFSHFASVHGIADWLQAAAAQGRPVTLIGYSQGGFQVLKVARVLSARGIDIALVVSIGRGGVGWLMPAQWGFRPRLAQTRIRRLLNVYSHADPMGTDPRAAGNALKAPAGMSLDTIAFARSDAVDHIALVRCYPEQAVHPAVRRQFLEPLARALADLS